MHPIDEIERELGKQALPQVQGTVVAVLGAVGARVLAREERRVGRHGPARDRVAVLVDDPVRRHAVQVRAGGAVVAVGTQVIGPGGVHRDQDDVRARRAVASRAADGEHGQESQEEVG